MEESNILIAIIALVIGGIIGYLAGRSSSTAAGQQQQQQVDGLKTEIELYKDSVADHFKQTATMVNEMNESYKGVVQHLAKGSQDLCDAGTAKDIEARLIPQLAPKEEEVNPSEPAQQSSAPAFEPPRDYAPKKPDEVGALSEHYGVQPTAPEATAPVEPAVVTPETSAKSQ